MTSSSLRVLHVLEATLGGTRRYLEDIVTATADGPLVQGLVYGTSRADPGFAQLLTLTRSAGWYLVAADDMRRAVHPLADARSVATVRHAIRDFNPTILHVHSAKAGAIGRIAALTCRPAAPAVVYSPHALPARLGRAYMLAERALAPGTKRFIAVSDSERREIVGEGMANASRVDVVYPRIDAQSYAPRDRAAARHSLRLPDVPIVIGIGRLAWQKDPANFVRTLARVRAAHPTTIGIWVGDGELRDEVVELAAALGLNDAFAVAGWIVDVRPYIAACDVLLSTSRYESFGYVIPETLSMERPVVATRVMGTVDVVFSAAQRMLFEPDHVDDAAQSILTLLNDSKLAAELGRLGRLSVIERFSTTAMRSALCTSYDETLK